jgi:probable O-glycosylation ligase (exosortase A-associated)
MIHANNALAMALIMILPLMRYLQLHTPYRWVRWGMAGAMVLSGLSILASYSRGAFVAAAVMAMMMLLKSQRRIMIGAALAFVLVGMLSFMPEKWFDRMETIQHYEEDRSVTGRINAWWFAYNLAKDRPVLGGGFSVFQSREMFERYAPEPERIKNAHSIYFEVLGEHGFVGLALFLVLWIATLRTGTRIIRRTRGRDDLRWARDLAAMVQVGLIGYAVNGLFLNKAFFDLSYHLVAIMALTQVLVAKALEAAPEQAAEMTERAARPVSSPAPTM